MATERPTKKPKLVQTELPCRKCNIADEVAERIKSDSHFANQCRILSGLMPGSTSGLFMLRMVLGCWQAVDIRPRLPGDHKCKNGLYYLDQLWHYGSMKAVLTYCLARQSGSYDVIDSRRPDRVLCSTFDFVTAFSVENAIHGFSDGQESLIKQNEQTGSFEVVKCPNILVDCTHGSINPLLCPVRIDAHLQNCIHTVLERFDRASVYTTYICLYADTNLPKVLIELIRGYITPNLE